MHGAGGLFWDPLLDALSASHRVIAPEHPGAGDSQGIEHVEDLWDLVLYYNELLDSFGVERATLVGHSFGGMVAAEIAATSPHRVDKLVLIAPIGLWRDDHPVPDISGIDRPRAARPGVRRSEQPDGGLDAGAGPVRPRLAVPGVADDGEHPAVHLAAARQGPVEAGVPDEGADAARVGGPGPLVHPAYGDDFAAAIADSRIEIVDGAGHVPQLEQAERTIALITAFVG